MAWDVGKLSIALYTGVGVGAAAADVALSTVGVLSPIPGTGQALKAARALEKGAEAVKVVKNTEKIAESVKKTSKIDRSAFKKERESFWKKEADNKPSNYASDDLARMEKGKPPIGPDGHPMELHHKDRTMDGGLEPMSRTDHRLGDNYKKNHPD